MQAPIRAPLAGPTELRLQLTGVPSHASHEGARRRKGINRHGGMNRLRAARQPAGSSRITLKLCASDILENLSQAGRLPYIQHVDRSRRDARINPPAMVSTRAVIESATCHAGMPVSPILSMTPPEP